MALDNMGISLDADFLAALALQCFLEVCFTQKQAHFITGTAVGISPLADNKLDHPAGAVLEPLHSQNVMAL